MATLKLTIFKAKILKDGRHKIRIAVCHKHETSYIVTRFIIDSLSEFKNGQVVKRPDAAVMNKKLRTMLNEYQDRLDAIRNTDMYTCPQLKTMLVRSLQGDGCTFLNVCDAYIQELHRVGKDKYAEMMVNTKRVFIEYTKGDIALADLTPELVDNLAEHVGKKEWSDATRSMFLRNVRTIINRAVKKRLVVYEVNPFISCRIPRSPVRDVALPVPVMQKILSCEPESRYMQICRDIFSLSFYLGGINMVDLMQLKFDGDSITFRRKKIKDRVDSSTTLKIPDEAKAIISRWADTSGKLEFGYSFDYENFRRHISRGVVKLAESLGIKERVIFYSARKSFAQYASELGVPDNVIDYCLGHSDKTRGVIRYYTKVRERQAEIAIKRVIDYIKNPGLYKDFIEMRADIMMSRM